ncbi:MAG: hypothetical protein JWR90_1929 [Marmoricola sp.]|nr:hypothetical protein [Marmoricola sp.]
MAQTFAGGALRVTTPPGHAAKPAGRTRGLEDTPTDTIVAALEDSDLALVQGLDLVPHRGKDLAAPRSGTVELELDLPADTDGVVLLERDGVYSWHLPAHAGERTRRLEKGPHTARFEIDVRPSETGAPQRTKSLLGAAVHGAAQVLVFRFAAPALLKKAIEKMESHVRPGLVHLAGDTRDGWTRFDTLDQLDLPKDRPARLLLLVHGTFSSTESAFAAFGVDENGRGFLRAAIAAYDAVIGFDHKTLSVDPRQNAEALLKRLRTHRGETVIDVITHSRGGLVTRAFAEEILPDAKWPGTVDNAVFVAATNAGTHLADPERWGELVDLYTNLAAASTVGLVGVVKGIGALVKYLVAYAADNDDVPGLQAMVPGGAFVTELNQTQPGQPGPGTSWFVVSSNFHVSLDKDHHSPPEFPRELVLKLGEGFLDQLFEGDNDLVVDTSSMSAIDEQVGGFVRDTFALGENDVVYHTNYFDQLSVIEAISGWLPLGLGAGGGEDMAVAEMAEPPAAAAMEAPVEQLRSARRAAPPPVEPPADPTPASLAAEMPAEVVAKQEFAVRVRLSRREIAVTEGAAHAEADVAVDADRPVTVQVIGKSNATVIAPDTDVLALPPGGGVSELQFRARSLASGPVAVLVVVRQGRVPIATLRLDGDAVKKGGVPSGTAATATTHPGIDAPELDGLPCLDIVERELPNGSVIYQYAVRLLPGQPAAIFESKPIKDRVLRIGKILDDVADLWRTAADPRERERKLQDIGSTMYGELFPEAMQAHLWKHRARIKDLIVYADEPFVPWELVHLKPPNGPRPTRPRFLAQSGLVRWQLGSFPPREMRVREGHARSLCPEYRDPRFALSDPTKERLFLEERFGATPVTATPAGVRTLLRSGTFDLLHFSGHGAADPDDILDAKLLLQGRKRAGTVEAEYLGATTVSENAARAKQGPGPLVVLNACQVGRAGDLLTTVGGFAQAFLDAGASAFVSCLWSVQQEPSRVFVEKLYEELLAGRTMAAASALAREKTRKAGDATWLSFVVYARPDAVLVTS